MRVIAAPPLVSVSFVRVASGGALGRWQAPRAAPGVGPGAGGRRVVRRRVRRRGAGAPRWAGRRAPTSRVRTVSRDAPGPRAAAAPPTSRRVRCGSGPVTGVGAAPVGAVDGGGPAVPSDPGRSAVRPPVAGRAGPRRRVPVRRPGCQPLGPAGCAARSDGCAARCGLVGPAGGAPLRPARRRRRGCPAPEVRAGAGVGAAGSRGVPVLRTPGSPCGHGGSRRVRRSRRVAGSSPSRSASGRGRGRRARRRR